MKYGYKPDKISPPGHTFLDILKSRGITQAKAARLMSRPIKTINEIVKGKCAITQAIAIQIESITLVPAEFWVAREALYRLSLAKVRGEE